MLAEQRLLADQVLTEEDAERVRAEAGEAIGRAVEVARAAAVPQTEEAFRHVFVD